MTYNNNATRLDVLDMIAELRPLSVAENVERTELAQAEETALMEAVFLAELRADSRFEDVA